MGVASQPEMCSGSHLRYPFVLCALRQPRQPCCVRACASTAAARARAPPHAARTLGARRAEDQADVRADELDELIEPVGLDELLALCSERLALRGQWARVGSRSMAAMAAPGRAGTCKRITALCRAPPTSLSLSRPCRNEMTAVRGSSSETSAKRTDAMLLCRTAASTACLALALRTSSGRQDHTAAREGAC